MKVQLNVRVCKDLYDKLKLYAMFDGVKLSKLVNDAVEEYLKKREGK